MSEQQYTKRSTGRPPLSRFIGEHITVWKELWQSYLFEKKYPITSNGDGHPVLMIPGFLGSDLSTARIRKFIKKKGYTPYSWGLGRNYGDIRKLNLLQKKIEELHEKHQSKVSIIGWSLGGVYARQLAKEKPHLIRQVITLASPFADILQPNNAAWLYKLINDRRPVAEADEKWLIDIPAPAPVPTTAIYSRDDGIVPWQACMEQEVDAFHQNVEVTGGHFGMAHNPSVWVIVEDRLKLKADTWKPFQREENHPKDLIFFPS